MQNVWHIQWLGGVAARQGERVVTRFRTQKTVLLLAWLALSPGRAYVREALAELLWPDADGEASRASLPLLQLYQRHKTKSRTVTGHKFCAKRVTLLKRCAAKGRAGDRGWNTC